MIAVGDCFNNDSVIYRVCAIDYSNERYALADMSRLNKGNFEKPQILTADEFRIFCRENALVKSHYELPVELSFSDHSLESKGLKLWLDKRDAKWQMLQPLTTPELIHQYLFGAGINKEVLAQMRAGGWSHKGSHYRALNRYLALGMTKNALLPVSLKKVGSNGPKYALSTDVKAKRGRKSDLPLEQTRGICEQDKKNIVSVLSKYKAANRKFTIQQVWRDFDTLHQRTEMQRELDDGTVHKIIQPYNKKQCISYDQFYYHLRKLLDVETRAKLTVGHLRYAKDLAPRTGSAIDGVLGATHRYEVDATVLDIYVAYPYKVGLTVGRPVLYLVVDVYSTMIVGMYLGFSGPDSAGVMQALSNACLCKVEFARRYGVDISEDEWPAHYIPLEITIDNGREFKETMISSALRSLLGIHAVNIAAVYRGDAKGTIERRFGVINDSIIHHQPGAIFKQQDRTESHPSNQAYYDYNQLVALIIAEIIFQNKSANRLHRLNFQASVDNCGITPEEIFLHSVKHDLNGGLPTTSEDNARVNWAFLPEEEATVTDHSIYFDGLEYVSDHQKIAQMFSAATKKRFKIPVKRLRDFVNYLWYRSDDGEFIQLNLKNVNNTSRYLDQPWEIVGHRLFEEKIISHNAQENERFQRAERDNRIAQAVSGNNEQRRQVSAQDASRKSIQPGIKERKAEQHEQIRAAEAANLARTLTQNNPLALPADKNDSDYYDLDAELFG
jgi:hypothetical protein